MEMQKEQLIPYEGTEDYIFISYSHRDIQEVYPILMDMKEAGYRLWYDEGIDPGTEWPESIGAHLNGCKVCIAFMSPDSLASNNCRREINYALSKNKRFLSVILKPVEMSPGVEMQISSYQSILKYKYRRQEDFLRRLYSVDALEGCQIPKPEPEQEPEIPPKESEPAAVSEKKPKKEAAAKKEKKKRPDRKFSAKQIILGAAAVFLMAVILLFGSLAGWFTSKVVVGGVQYKDNSSSQTVENCVLTAKDIKKLASLKNCTTLNLNGCELEEGALSQLAAMEQLYHLELVNCTGVENLSWLGSLEELYNLKIAGCGLTDEALGQLQGDEKVIILDLSENELTSVSALKGWTKLSTLRLSGNQIRSLEGMETLEKLTTLYLDGNQVENLDSLETLIHITVLNLADNQLKTLKPLAYFSQLEKINVSGNTELKDLDTLAVCSGKLISLDISGVPTENLDFLSGAENMQTLYAAGCGLTDIAGISGSTGLTTVDLSQNDITDVSALAEMSELDILDLSNNAIETLAGLKNTFQDKTYLYVNLQNNQLKTLEGLPPLSYQTLLLVGNPLKSLSAADGVTGANIALDCSDDLDFEQLSKLGFLSYCVTSVSLERQIELEETLKSSLKIMKPEEVNEAYWNQKFAPVL